MKKILFIIPLLALLLASCGSSEKPKSEVIAWAESIIHQYPNYSSNDIAKKSVTDSITAFAERQKGKPASILNGVEFKFDRLIENPQTGAHSAAMYTLSNNLITHVDGKEIFCGVHVNLLGIVDEQTAATLDKDLIYKVTGAIREWDGENLVVHSHVVMPGDLELGTFILDDMKVEKIEK